MKILIVRTFPDFLDTTKYNVQEIGLAKALIRAGHEVGIVLYNGKNKDAMRKIPVDYKGTTKEIKIYYLHGWNFFKNGIFPSLNKIIRQYDVIQVHEYDQITSWIYYAWSKKNVVIYHGPYYDDFNKGYNFKCKIFDNVFLKIKNNKNIPCLTKSHAAAEFLRSKGFLNVTAVGVGLDVENFESVVDNSEKKIEVEDGNFTLLYVGKIEKRRNSMFLADVIDEITSLYDDVKCIVIGNGEEAYLQSFLRKIGKLIDTGKVRYYPSATQSQLADLYRKVSLMLFPSSYEIFGMVLAEAVYFGLPVISTRNGGADMLISDKKWGIIIDELDVGEWIKGIETYRMGTKKSNVFLASESDKREDLLWDNICKKMIDEYQRYYE